MATDFFDPEYMEDVFVALFAQLQTAIFPDGFKLNTVGRAFKAPDDVPVSAQPALYMVPGPMHVEQKEFALAKWTFTAIVFLYFRSDVVPLSPNPLAATQGNLLVWGIMNSLAAPPGPYEKQTLGGLVTHCWIEGEVVIETAAEQVVVAIPIFLLAGNVS